MWWEKKDWGEAREIKENGVSHPVRIGTNCTKAC
jgi:hypothetical protein